MANRCEHMADELNSKPKRGSLGLVFIPKGCDSHYKKCGLININTCIVNASVGRAKDMGNVVVGTAIKLKHYELT